MPGTGTEEPEHESCCGDNESSACAKSRADSDRPGCKQPRGDVVRSRMAASKTNGVGPRLLVPKAKAGEPT